MVSQNGNTGRQGLSRRHIKLSRSHQKYLVLPSSYKDLQVMTKINLEVHSTSTIMYRTSATRIDAPCWVMWPHTIRPATDDKIPFDALRVSMDNCNGLVYMTESSTAKAVSSVSHVAPFSSEYQILVSILWLASVGQLQLPGGTVFTINVL